MKFKSAVFTQVSGSVGGVTFFHGKSGLQTRARSIPINPDTPPQAVIKSAMANLVNRWANTLTDAQRDAWAVYAANVTVTNKLGDQINLPGNAMYTRSNVARLQAGLAAVDDGPEVFNIGENGVIIPGIDVTLQNIDVAFSAGDTWVNEDGANLLVYVSRPQNGTINFFKGPYQYAGLVAGDATTPPTSPQALSLPFPAAIGQKVYARTRVSRADGRFSDSFRGFGIGA